MAITPTQHYTVAGAVGAGFGFLAGNPITGLAAGLFTKAIELNGRDKVESLIQEMKIEDATTRNVARFALPLIAALAATLLTGVITGSLGLGATCAIVVLSSAFPPHFQRMTGIDLYQIPVDQHA